MNRTKERAREPTRAATATKKKKEGIESFHIYQGKRPISQFDWKKTRNPISSHSLTIGRGAEIHLTDSKWNTRHTDRRKTRKRDEMYVPYLTYWPARTEESISNRYKKEDSNSSSLNTIVMEALSAKSEEALKPIEHSESSGLAADLLPDLSTILMY